MAVGGERLVELIAELVSEDERTRSVGSDRVGDWMGSYAPNESRILAEILAMTASCERSTACLEAQLHALAEMDTAGQIGDADLSPLWEIDAPSIPVENREYLDCLQPYIARRSRLSPPPGMHG